MIEIALTTSIQPTTQYSSVKSSTAPSKLGPHSVPALMSYTAPSNGHKKLMDHQVKTVLATKPMATAEIPRPPSIMSSTAPSKTRLHSAPASTFSTASNKIGPYSAPFSKACKPPLSHMPDSVWQTYYRGIRHFKNLLSNFVPLSIPV